jgi:hypothetical protein
MYQRALEYPQKIKTFFGGESGAFPPVLKGVCGRFTGWISRALHCARVRRAAHTASVRGLAG